MTGREFFEKVIEENISSDVTEYAEKQVALLDARNAKRASTPSKKAVENVPIKDIILAVLENNGGEKTTKVIAAAVNSINKTEYSVQKISALLTQLVNEGKVEKGKPEKKLCTYQLKPECPNTFITGV